MDLSSQNFDPLTFLNVDPDSLSETELSKLRTSLSTKMGEYILLKLSEYLNDEQLDQVIHAKDGGEMISMLRGLVPDLDAKLEQEMQNFKNEFDNVN